MKNFIVIPLVILSIIGCAQKNQEREVGGRCEDCDLLFKGMPAKLTSETTIGTPAETGEPLTLTGTVYRQDGKTPAEGVIVYFYHTDRNGLYSPGKTESERTRHGRLRGWIRTGKDGRYSLTTIRPASYPDSRALQHIHILIKEEGLAPYWIDDVNFEDDPFITAESKSHSQKRGGSGIIKLAKDSKNTWVGKRDIILGKNISGY